MRNPSDEIVIEFRDVVKTYRRMHRLAGGLKLALLHLPRFIRDWRRDEGIVGLNGVSLEIRRGECLGICGHNGSGKSTMLGLMSGILPPTDGEVIVRGRVCSLLGLGAGFHADLTGRENVFLNGVILGMSRREIEQRFDSIMEFSGVRAFIDEPIRAFSSGMLLRLGFSVAVHTDPDVLLIDEVLAVGDLEFQTKCLAKMQEFREKSVTIVVATHSYAVMKQMCDQVLLLEHGRIAAQGSPAEVEPKYYEAAARATLAPAL